MPTTDPHEGGRLEDMAEKGTEIPNDAGVMNLIPSVPRPDQIPSDSETAPDLAAAADNPTDIPRTHRDTGMSGEVMTGTGDRLPARAVEDKNLAGRGNEPAAKGHTRDAKHGKQKVSDVDKYASEGPGVDEAPGEEDLDQDQLRSRRDGV